MKMKRMIIGIIGVFLLLQPISAQNWQGTKRLTWNSGDSIFPAIAIGPDDHIHVVWQDETPGDFEIYYKRSTNGGITWSTRRMTYSVGNSAQPEIAVDANNHVLIVWIHPISSSWEICYKKSTDGGDTWNAAERLTWNAGESYRPALAADTSGSINVAWDDDTSGNYEIYYRRSTNGGTTWAGTKRLTWDSNSSYFPAITVDTTNNIHVTWRDNSHDGNFEIYYKRSTDGGTTWPKFERLSMNAGDSLHPAIAVDSSSTIHVVWMDYTFIVPEIFYGRSTNGGGTWDYARRLTWNDGESENPGIATDLANRTHLVWQDFSFGNCEILYKRSTNGGSTWSRYNRLTWNPGGSEYPVIAVDSSGNIHLVWQDYTTGAPEIYYKKGIQ